MSGLISKQNNNVYLALVKGVITQRVKPGTEGATQRENKKGDVVFEKQYSGLSGFIVNIRKESAEFDGVTQYQWRITFIVDGDDGKNYILTIPEASRICGQIMNRLPNVDFTKEVDLFTGEGVDKETGKPFQWATIKQGGEKVMPKFTKDNPNGLPPLSRIKVRGQEMWDSSDQLAFYDKMIETEIIPKIERSTHNTPLTEEKEQTSYPSIDPKKIDVEMDVFQGVKTGKAPATGEYSNPIVNDLPF